MQSINSASQFFKVANGARVRKTCEGVPTIDMWPDMVANIRQQLLEQGASESDIEETPDKIAIGAQYWRKPAMVAREVGKLLVRSKDYAFTPECGRTHGRPIYGDKTGSTIENGKLVKRYDNGLTVTLEILDGELSQ